MKIQIINGPNLNLLGKREPTIYGDQSFEAYFLELKKNFSSIELHHYQSNIEGEIIDKIQNVGFDFDGVVINAGAYTHTSIGIADAIAAVPAPCIEVHLSNVYNREDFRQHSFMAKNCVGVVAGFGLKSYHLAIQSLLLS
jgi:3-dehydroquinate dehydratase-2